MSYKEIIKSFIDENKLTISLNYTKLSVKQKQQWITITTRIDSLNEKELEEIKNTFLPEMQSFTYIAKIDELLQKNEKIILESINDLDEVEKDLLGKYLKEKNTLTVEELKLLQDIIIHKILHTQDNEEKQEKKINYSLEIIDFMEEYQVELKTIFPKLNSREKSYYTILKSEDLSGINYKQSKTIYEYLLPRLKEEFKEYHSTSAKYINIINMHTKKITSHPGYRFVINNASNNDKILFQKFLSNKYALDQQKLKFLIAKTIPTMLSQLKYLSSKEQKAIQIIEIANSLNKEALKKLNQNEYKLLCQIKNYDIKHLTEEEINCILKVLERIKQEKQEIKKEPIKEEKNIVQETKNHKNSLIKRQEQKGYNAETTLKAISFLSEAEQKKLQKRYGVLYNEYIADDGQTKSELTKISQKIMPKIDRYSKLIMENISDEEIKKLEKQSHISGRKREKNKNNEIILRIAYNALTEKEKILLEKRKNIEDLTKEDYAEAKYISTIKLNNICNKIKGKISELKDSLDVLPYIYTALYKIVKGETNELLDENNNQYPITDEELKSIYNELFKSRIFSRKNNLKTVETIYEIEKLSKFKKETVDKAINLYRSQYKRKRFKELYEKRFIRNEELTQKERAYLTSIAFKEIEKICVEIESGIQPSHLKHKGRKKKHKTIYEMNKLKKFSKETVDEAVKNLEKNDSELLKKQEKGEALNAQETKRLYGSVFPRIAAICSQLDPTLNSYLYTNIHGINNLIKLQIPGIQEFYEKNKDIRLSQLSEEDTLYLNESIIPCFKKDNKDIKERNQSLLIKFKKLNISKETIDLAVNYLNKEEQTLLKNRYGENYDSRSWIIEITSKEKSQKAYHLNLIINKLKDIIDLINKGKTKEEIELYLEEFKPFGQKNVPTAKFLSEYPIVIRKIAYLSISEKYQKALTDNDNNIKIPRTLIANAKTAVKKKCKYYEKLLSEKNTIENRYEDVTDRIIYLLLNDIHNKELNNLTEQQINNIYKLLTNKISKTDSLNQNSIYNFKHIERFRSELIDQVIENELDEKDKEIVTKYINKNQLTKKQLSRLYFTIIIKIEKSCQKYDPENIYKKTKVSNLIKKESDKYKVLTEEEKSLIDKYYDSLLMNIPESDQKIIISIIAKEQIKDKNKESLYEFQEKQGYSKEITDQALEHIGEKYTTLLKEVYGEKFDKKPIRIKDPKVQKRVSNAKTKLKSLSKKIKNGEKISHKKSVVIPKNDRKKINELLGITAQEMQGILKYATIEDRILISKNDNGEHLSYVEQKEKIKLISRLKTLVKKYINEDIQKVTKIDELTKIYYQTIKEIIDSTDLNTLIKQIINSNTKEEKIKYLSNKIFNLVDQPLIQILKETKTDQEVLIFLLVTDKIPEINLSIKDISSMFNIDATKIKNIIYSCMKIIIENQSKQLEKQSLVLKKENES